MLKILKMYLNDTRLRIYNPEHTLKDIKYTCQYIDEDNILYTALIIYEQR